MKIKELTLYHEDDPSQTLVVLSMKRQTKQLFELECEDHDGEHYKVIVVLKDHLTANMLKRLQREAFEAGAVEDDFERWYRR